MHLHAKLRGLTCLIFAATFFGVTAQMPAQQTPAGQQPPGQQPPGQQPPAAGAGQNPNQAPPARELPPDLIRPNYVLGPNDQILIRAPGVEEINEKPFRIDAEGNISLPLAGRFRAGGMTQQELETELVRRLKEYIRDPQVIVTVVQFRSEPVFFVGAFTRPGIYPLQGRRQLVEMLTSIGGLTQNASRHIKITRRAEYGAIPLPGALTDPEKKISTVEISMASLRENINPAEDIILQPYDVISVERAELVYINGEVARTGAIELNERDSISLLQALTNVGGFTRDAKRDKVRILRPILNTTRRAEIEIDTNEIYSGKANDFPLLPNDVLYVPRSFKRVALTTLGQILLTSGPYIIFTLVR
jgi:polysaccharide biosynthesis/export protein